MSVIQSLAAVGLTLCVGVLAGCASLPGVTGDLSIGPGGRAVGTVNVPPRVETLLRLRNEGMGLADFRIATAAGELLQGGALGRAETKYLTEVADRLIVTVVATGDAPVVVDYEVRSAHGADIAWDLQHAHPSGD